MTAAAVAPAALSARYPLGNALQQSTLELCGGAMGRAHGLDGEALERLAVVVRELGTNIVRHARTGQVLLRAAGPSGPGGWVEVLALDKGPGIADLPRVLRDTADASGDQPDTGLRATRRAADCFDIFAPAGGGTAVFAQVGAPFASAVTVSERLMRDGVGVVCVPLRGEHECGDAWAVECSVSRIAVLLVDGLGHGPDAALAAQEALGVFRERSSQAPQLMFRPMHLAMHNTRGAALSVAAIDRADGLVTFCGVGNVDGRVLSAEGNRHLVPQNGIVGHMMPGLVPTSSEWPTAGRLVLHSDGIASRWRPELYPGLPTRHPALMAGVLFRDWARERDDATVLVLREPAVVAA